VLHRGVKGAERNLALGGKIDGEEVVTLLGDHIFVKKPVKHP